jgi:hypothetical protein
MKKHKFWFTLLLLPLLTLSLQSCSGLFSNSPFQNKVSTNGKNVGINQDSQAAFKGNIYFTLNQNLYVLNGQKQLTQLTKGIDARDPSVSPDGKYIAFTIYYTDYSDLAIMPATGGNYKILLNGNGTYEANPASTYPGQYPDISTYHWYAQPSWADNTHLLILSDIEKADWSAAQIGEDAFLLDPILFLFDINDPTDFVNNPGNYEVAYPTYGDGGLRDPSIRPGHPDQAVFTSYNYDASSQYQVDQVDLVNVHAIEENYAYPTYTYEPGIDSMENDPSVPLTPGSITKPETQDISNIMPSFSPDGNTIAYVRRINATQMNLYTMPVANGVTGPASGLPTFNPNDPTNLATALQPYNKSSLLLSGQYISDPIWSPDGTQIIYYNYTKETFDLWLATVVKNPQTGAYSIKAGSEVQLTQTNGALDTDSRPFWSA